MLELDRHCTCLSRWKAESNLSSSGGRGRPCHFEDLARPESSSGEAVMSDYGQLPDTRAREACSQSAPLLEQGHFFHRGTRYHAVCLCAVAGQSRILRKGSVGCEAGKCESSGCGDRGHASFTCSGGGARCASRPRDKMLDIVQNRAGSTDVSTSDDVIFRASCIDAVWSVVRSHGRRNHTLG